MKKQLLLSLSGLLIAGNVLFAQNRTVVTLEKSSGQEEENSVKGHGSSSIKLNPLLFFRGDVPLYFEKSITRQFAVEIGAGFTHTDYFSTWVDEANEDDNPKADLSQELGYSGRVGLRYYAANYGFAPEGTYFALEYRYQKYNAVLNSYDALGDLNEELDRTNQDFKLTVGYVDYQGENVFFEYYAGFGIRSRNIDRVKDAELPYSYILYTKEDLVPYLSLGFKIGIGLGN